VDLPGLIPASVSEILRVQAEIGGPASTCGSTVPVA